MKNTRKRKWLLPTYTLTGPPNPVLEELQRYEAIKLLMWTYFRFVDAGDERASELEADWPFLKTCQRPKEMP